MTNKHIQSTFPYEQIIEGGYASPAFEQFLRSLHLRTGNKVGIDVAEVQKTAQDALQTAVNAQTIADLTITSLFKIDQNLQSTNESLQGIHSSILANQSLIFALLSQLSESIDILNQNISKFQKDN